MVKTAYDTVLDMMLNAPCSIHNATVAYHQLFLVWGNGFAWNTDGRIVQERDDTEPETNGDFVLYSPVRDNELFCKRLEKAVSEQVKAHLLNRTFTLGDELESAHNGNEADYLLSEEVADKLNEHIHKVFTVKERIRDFTLPCDGYRFHPIDEQSNLNNIPDNVTWDWLDAVQTFIEILDKYPDSVRDPKCLLPGIKKRVKSILKAKADDYYKQLDDDFDEDYNE